MNVCEAWCAVSAEGKPKAESLYETKWMCWRCCYYMYVKQEIRSCIHPTHNAHNAEANLNERSVRARMTQATQAKKKPPTTPTSQEVLCLCKLLLLAYLSKSFTITPLHFHFCWFPLGLLARHLIRTLLIVNFTSTSQHEQQQWFQSILDHHQLF